MDLLVLGASGLLGREVLQQGAGAKWLRLDVRDPKQVRALLEETRPDVVIDAAYRQDDWTTTAFRCRPVCGSVPLLHRRAGRPGTQPAGRGRGRQQFTALRS